MSMDAVRRLQPVLKLHTTAAIYLPAYFTHALNKAYFLRRIGPIADHREIVVSLIWAKEWT